MKILVIGSGGREHAIVACLSESPKVTKLYAAPGNAGIAKLAKLEECRPVKATDIDGIVALAREISADMVFVAPDDPLVLGAVDALNAAGFPTFGPRKNAAVLEGSKHFSKEFMRRHNIPTADYHSFTDCAAAIAHIKAQNSYPAVIKCDGLALGKGVIIAQNEAEAVAAVESMLVGGKFGESGKRVVIEEYLEGNEVTVLAFTDGKTVVPMPASTDHKRALDGDKGLNTGGMGVITRPPYYTDEIAAECMRTIFLPTIRGMADEGTPFKGCLYFGLMLTGADGKTPKVIEYNCRFGDPETQAVLPLLETDLADIITAVWEERLDSLEVKFSARTSACVVMASGGYPEKYGTGYPISGIESAETNGVRVYHAGTAASPDGAGCVTAGGRVLAVTAVADTLQESLNAAYGAIAKISFKDAHYRTDIGKKAL